VAKEQQWRKVKKRSHHQNGMYETKYYQLHTHKLQEEIRNWFLKAHTISAKMSHHLKPVHIAITELN